MSLESLPAWILSVAALVLLAVIIFAVVTGRDVETKYFRIGAKPTGSGDDADGGDQDPGRVEVLKNMPAALLEVVEHPIRHLRMVAYVGNLELDALKHARREHLEGATIRLLAKDPTSEWFYLQADGDQCRHRREQALQNQRSTRRDIFRDVANDQTPAGHPEVVRWYRGGPVARAVLVEPVDGDAALYLGLYTTAERGEERDYSGSGRPVLKVRTPELIDDFRRWFDFTWHHSRQDPDA